MSFIFTAFGKILATIYDLIPNYGITLIIFTLITKIMLLPFGIKFYQSMKEREKLKPEVQKLEERFKNDRTKKDLEVMNLYKSHGIQPLDGCLPMLLQLPLIWILMQVISKPLTYMFGFSKAGITSLQKILGMAFSNKIDEMAIIDAFTQKMSSLGINNAHIVNLDFFGINLGMKASFGTISIGWLIPILVGLSTFLMVKFGSMPQMGNDNPANQKSNLIMQVVLSVFISFSFPLGVGLYWVISSIIQTLQQLILEKLHLEQL